MPLTFAGLTSSASDCASALEVERFKGNEILAVPGKFPRLWRSAIFAYPVCMKQIHNTAQKRSFRRWVRKMFASWIKHQDCHCEQELERIFVKLQDIEDLIDIIARQVARWTKVKAGD